ncbi:porin family protein [bacterium]|nr:porin family protein [bacterium]MBU1983071.1 porin family protein [bacterium]
MNSNSTVLMTFVGACILLSVCCTEASAGSGIGFKGIGPRIGYVDPESDLDGTVEFGVAFEFGEFVPQLHWDGSVSFWSTGQDWDYYDGNSHHKYDWTLRDFVLRSGVNYHFLEGDWVPYAGGGLGLHFYSWDYSGAPNWANSSDTEFGFYIDGGIEHAFNEKWLGQLQLQFDFADPDQTALLFNLIYRLQ